METFEKKKHVRFFTRILQILPNRYSLLDTSRLTVAFFALSGLDVLNSLDVLSFKNKQDLIEWIYTLQVVPNSTNSNRCKCGFRGSSTNGITTKKNETPTESTNKYDCSHITMTYTGLACLLILNDDLKRVNKQACLDGIKALQIEDGSFKSTYDGSENDMRFLYCACCVCTFLDDFSAINTETAAKFIQQSLCYDGGFGQGPNQESHGGSTFCATASLLLMKNFNILTKKQEHRLKSWCISRQKQGFHGRPNKDDDTCYSFWVGATLKLLNVFDYIDFDKNEQFLFSTQDEVVGGFAKWPQIHPDALHSYMGICGLSLMGLQELGEVDPALSITLRAKKHMLHLNKQNALQKERKENALKEGRNRTKSNTSTLDKTHTGTVVLAFVVGLGAVVMPWIYKAYFSRG